MSAIPPSEADHLARTLTYERLRIEAEGETLYLIEAGTGKKMQLLPYQLTTGGVAGAISDFGDWFDKPR